MTLIYRLDLDILPLDMYAKIQVRMSVYSAGRETDGQTDDAKIITPIMSEMWGVKIYEISEIGHQLVITLLLLGLM